MPLITGPIGDFISRNASGISNAGAGLASGGFAGFAQGAAAGRPVDEQRQKAQAEMANQQALRAKYSTMFTKAGAPDYAMLVGDGLVEPGAAYLDWVKSQGKGVDPTTTISGRADLAQQYGLTGDDARSYVLTGKLPEGVKPPSPTTDMQNYEYGLAHPEFAANMTQKGGQAETSLTPVWGTDANGKPLMGQLNKAGKFVQTALPDGVTPMDPMALAGGKTSATVDAKSSAAARLALPAAQQAFDMANKAADALLGDSAGMADQFGNTLGFPNQWMPVARPGSDMARFRSELEQGQGNAFLQARNVLKGAGQVTDYEGAKAEGAYSRMSLAAKNNNQEEFIAAVQDFKAAVAEGYQKLQAAAQGDYSAGGPGVSAQPGNTTSTGVQWSVTP